MVEWFALTDGQSRGLHLLIYVLVVIFGALGLGRWIINKFNYLMHRGYGRIVFSRNHLEEDGDACTLQLRSLFAEKPLSEVVLDPILREKVVAAGKRCNEQHPFPVLPTDDEQQAWLDANLNFVAQLNAAGELAESLGLPVLKKWVWLVPACADGAKGTIAKFRTIWIGDKTLDGCKKPSRFKYERAYHYTRGNTLMMIHNAVRGNDACIDVKGRKVKIGIMIEIKVPAYSRIA